MAIKYYLFCCLYLMVWLSGYSQKTISRNVEDMTDRQVKNIEVKEDWKNEKIYLIKAVDTLTIDEAVEVDTVKVSLGKFLEVVYRVRGGSGEHLRVTKVVCVNNNHFGQSLSLETLNEEYSAKGTLKKRYSLDVNIFFNKGTYIARLTETIKTVNGGKKFTLCTLIRNLECFALVELRTELWLFVMTRLWALRYIIRLICQGLFMCIIKIAGIKKELIAILKCN